MKECKRGTHTTWERLFMAVENMASGNESIQKRLCGAVLHLCPLHVKDFPEKLQPDFKAILDETTKVDGPNGSIEASTNAMNDEQASEVAKKIFHLYDEIARNYCQPDLTPQRR